MNAKNKKEVNMWIGILLAAVGAILLLIVLWRPWKAEAPEENKVKFNKEKNNDNSETAVNIRQAAEHAGIEFKLFSKIRIKGWTKHSALIDYLFLSPQGIILFRTEETPAKSVFTKGKKWIVETENKNMEIKNPVNMNNYSINVLRSLLKKKCKNIYDKIKFTPVVVFNDKTEINVSKGEKNGLLIIKQNKIPDLIEMVSENPAVLTNADLNCIIDAIKSALVNN